MKGIALAISVEVKIKGVTPLLMHSPKFANPLHPDTKEFKKVSSKRKKTDEDYEKISYLEWLGGLYFDETHKFIYIPGEMIEASLREGAKATRQGKKVISSITVAQMRIPLEYKGPRNLDAMFNDPTFVDIRSVRVNGTARLMRTRPIFQEWALTYTLMYDQSIIDGDALKEITDTAGMQACIGDYRPRYGKYVVTQWKQL